MLSGWTSAGSEAGGHRLGQPQLDGAGRASDQGADGLDDVEGVADATDAAGAGIGVAEALAPPPGDPVRDGDAAAFGRERSALEEAELPEASEPAQRGAAARVDEGGELLGGRDAGAVQQAQAGAIAQRDEPDVEARHERSLGALAEDDAHGSSPVDRSRDRHARHPGTGLTRVDPAARHPARHAARQSRVIAGPSRARRATGGSVPPPDRRKTSAPTLSSGRASRASLAAMISAATAGSPGPGGRSIPPTAVGRPSRPGIRITTSNARSDDSCSAVTGANSRARLRTSSAPGRQQGDRRRVRDDRPAQPLPQPAERLRRERQRQAELAALDRAVLDRPRPEPLRLVDDQQVLAASRAGPSPAGRPRRRSSG